MVDSWSEVGGFESITSRLKLSGGEDGLVGG
jgi:hypothetical protein